MHKHKGATMEIKDEVFKGLTGLEVAVRVMGGKTATGKIFGYTAQGVQSWMSRGIPKRMVQPVSDYTGIPVEILKQKPPKANKNA